mmetsp:Transcript_67371/g.161072  ORF Transcript_67371/g.161072 Transcript_67371/m.161072 type:complete len:320 (-) Transcript_67371:60-1019(-)
MATCRGGIPAHGSCPEWISHTITPKLYASAMNAAPVEDAWPRSTSGADHAGVPSVPTVLVAVAPSSSLERPKSEIMQHPIFIRMLRLFRSRCATSREWRYDMPAAICETHRVRSRSESIARRTLSRSRSVSRSASSMIRMSSRASSVHAPNTRITYGCARLQTMSSSCRKASVPASICCRDRFERSMIFAATFWLWYLPAYTLHDPPLAKGSSSSLSLSREIAYLERLLVRRTCFKSFLLRRSASLSTWSILASITPSPCRTMSSFSSMAGRRSVRCSTFCTSTRVSTETRSISASRAFWILSLTSLAFSRYVPVVQKA